MIKNRSIVEVEVKGRQFRLECCAESPLDDVSEALAMINGFVQQRIQEALKPKEETNVDQH